METSADEAPALTGLSRGLHPCICAVDRKRRAGPRHLISYTLAETIAALAVIPRPRNQDAFMRTWIPCSAMLLALLVPAAGSAQPVAMNGYYYGNSYPAPGYEYPYARTRDGYSPNAPLARPPIRVNQAAPVDPMTGYPYEARPARRSAGTALASLPQEYESGSGYDD